MKAYVIPQIVDFYIVEDIHNWKELENWVESFGDENNWFFMYQIDMTPSICTPKGTMMIDEGEVVIRDSHGNYGKMLLEHFEQLYEPINSNTQNFIPVSQEDYKLLQEFKSKSKREIVMTNEGYTVKPVNQSPNPNVMKPEDVRSIITSQQYKRMINKY